MIRLKSLIIESYGDALPNAIPLNPGAEYTTNYRHGAIRMKDDGKASITEGPGIFILIDRNTVFKTSAENSNVAFAKAAVGVSWDPAGITDPSLGRPSDLLGLDIFDSSKNWRIWKYLKTKTINISWSASEPQTIYMEGDTGSYMITSSLKDALNKALKR